MMTCRVGMAQQTFKCMLKHGFFTCLHSLMNRLLFVVQFDFANIFVKCVRSSSLFDFSIFLFVLEQRFAAQNKISKTHFMNFPINTTDYHYRQCHKYKNNLCNIKRTCTKRINIGIENTARLNEFFANTRSSTSQSKEFFGIGTPIQIDI